MRQDHKTGRAPEQWHKNIDNPLADLELVFEGTHDAIAIVNVGEDGRFYYYAINKRYQEIAGKDQEYFKGKTPVEAHGEVNGRHITMNLLKCLEEKAPIQYHETLEMGGRVISGLVQLSPIMQRGKVVQVLSSTRDITLQKQIEMQLVEQMKNLEVLFTNSSDGIAFFDSTHLVTDINQRFTEIFGHTLEEIKGKNLDDVISQANVRQHAGELTQVLMTGTPVVTEAVRFHKDGHPIHLSIKGISVEVEGKITGGYGIYTDITREKMAREALRISEERWQFALEGSGNGVWDWNIESDKVFFSSQYQVILGYKVRELPAFFEEYLLLVHPEDREDLAETHKAHIAGNTEVMSLEYRVRCSNGVWKWVLSKGKVMRRDKDGKPLRMVGTITDITERKQYEDKIRFLSYNDKLTGLYNRAFFEEEMHRLDCPRNWPLSIMICDVDGLKMANDYYGHHVGDKLLQRIANVLIQACREDDVIARWGGDEFAILLPGTSEADALEVGERINLLCANHQDLPVKPSISWGVATKDMETQTLESLIRKGELGMYKQKMACKQSTHHQLRQKYNLPDLDDEIKPKGESM